MQLSRRVKHVYFTKSCEEEKFSSKTKIKRKKEHKECIFQTYTCGRVKIIIVLFQKRVEKKKCCGIISRLLSRRLAYYLSTLRIFYRVRSTVAIAAQSLYFFFF